MSWLSVGSVTLLIFSNFVRSEPSSIIVSQVQFLGNGSIKAKQLHSVIELHEPRIFSQKEFDPRIQKLDAISLRTYYVSNGFLSATVNDSFSIIDDKATLNYTINEGKQYFLQSIDVKGNKAIPTGIITSILGLIIDEPFNPIKVNSQMQTLEETYQEHGKYYVSFDFLPEIKDSVNALLLIEEGPNLTVDKISIDNIDSSEQYLVGRELLINEGENLKKSTIDNSKRRILETGIFSFVSIVPDLGTPSDSSVEVSVHVKPFKERRVIQSDGGFDKIEISDGLIPVPGIGGNLEWLNRSIFGSTNRISSKISADLPIEEQFHYPRLRVDANLSNQWIGSLRIPTRFKSFFHMFKNFADLEGPFIFRYGMQITTIHKFGERSYISMGVKWEKFEEPEELKENIEQKKVDIHYKLDQTNNPFFPSKGSIISIKINSTGGFLGGNREFLKFELDARKYINIFGKTILALRGNYGILQGWDNSDEQYEEILFDKFYLGGSTNLRAWDPLEFSVVTDSLGNSTNTPKGETFRFFINSEIRFPIYGLIGGVIFMDGGKLDVAEKWNSLADFQWDGGFGATLKTPLGPVRLEYASQLKDPSEWRIHLGVLYAF